MSGDTNLGADGVPVKRVAAGAADSAGRPSAGPPAPSGVEPKPALSSSAIDDDVTVLLLSLAARRRVGPFAPLLNRIERPDGPAWFLGAFETACRSAQIGMAALSDPRSGPEALRRLKSWAKSTLRAADPMGSAPGSDLSDDEEAVRLALLAYAVTVAIGLTVHNLRLSTRPPHEWDPLFVDLAELAPMPWAETFQRAAGK